MIGRYASQMVAHSRSYRHLWGIWRLESFISCITTQYNGQRPDLLNYFFSLQLSQGDHRLKDECDLLVGIYEMIVFNCCNTKKVQNKAGFSRIIENFIILQSFWRLNGATFYSLLSTMI